MQSSGDREVPRPVTKAALEAWVASGRPCRIPTSGRSMYPLLRAGCQVVLGRCSEDLGRGDVVVYFLGETMVVHRIVRVLEDRGKRIFRTKGDSSLCLDARPVAESEIIGRVVAIRVGDQTIDLRSPARIRGGRLLAFCSYCVGAVGSRLRGWLRPPPRNV